MNILILQGNTTKDFQMNKGVAKSSIAVRKYNGDTLFVDIVAFGKNAEYCEKYVKKGSSVVVSGSLEISEYNDRRYVSCSIQSISKCGGSKINADEQPKEEANEIQNLDQPEITVDDLPF